MLMVVALVAVAYAAGPPDVGSKVTFDLSAIDADGLIGPPDGLVAVGYELCIPDDPDALAEVQDTDPTIVAYRGSRGRIGCDMGEILCIGNTHQPDWRHVLEKLAALEYVARIDRHFAE